MVTQSTASLARVGISLKEHLFEVSEKMPDFFMGLGLCLVKEQERSSRHLYFGYILFCLPFSPNSLLTKFLAKLVIFQLCVKVTSFLKGQGTKEVRTGHM